MKELEPGCLAIVINSANGNNGKVVRVLEYIGEIKSTCKYKNYWKIDQKLEGIKIGTDKKSLTNFVDEHQLLRIDGHEDTQEDTQEIERNLCQ